MNNENKFSVNPSTNKKFLIPDDIDDRVNIENFINKNSNKKIVVVQGLGFVGAVMSLVCANSIKEDYAVIGVDLPNKENFWKIEAINEGVFPLEAEDKKIDSFFQKSIDKGNFYATYDPYAYSLANVIIVDINLDVKKNSVKNNILDSYDVDLSSFKAAISSIGDNCKIKLIEKNYSIQHCPSWNLYGSYKTNN